MKAAGTGTNQVKYQEPEAKAVVESQVVTEPTEKHLTEPQPTAPLSQDSNMNRILLEAK